MSREKDFHLQNVYCCKIGQKLIYEKKTFESNVFPVYICSQLYLLLQSNKSKKSLVIALLNVGKKNQVSYLCRKREMTKSERRNKKPEKYHIIHSSVRFLTRDFQQLSCFLKKFCQHPRLSDFLKESQFWLVTKGIFWQRLRNFKDNEKILEKWEDEEKSCSI